MNTTPDRNRFQWKQWLAALAASSPLLGIHFYLFWSSNAKFLIKGSLCWTQIVLIIGVIIGAVIADIFGRKRSLIVTSVFFTLGLVAWSLSRGSLLSAIFPILYLIGSGATCVLILLYVSEISSLNNNKSLMVLQLPARFFALFVISTRAFVKPQLEIAMILTIVLVAISMLFHIITISVCPETPGFLNWKKRYEDEVKSLDFFRGTADVVLENENPSNLIINSRINGDERQGLWERFGEIFQLANLKNLAIIFFLIIIRQAGGQDEFVLVIFDRYPQEPGSLLCFWAATLIFSIFVTLTIDVLVRKLYLLWLIGVNFVTVVIGVIVAKYFWAMLTAICVQYLCQIIFIAVTYTYVGESFTINIRAIAIAAVLTFEVLARSIHYLILSALGTENHLYFIQTQKYYQIAVLFAAFFILLKYFPKTNAVVRYSEIMVKNLADEERLSVEKVPSLSKINDSLTMESI